MLSSILKVFPVSEEANDEARFTFAVPTGLNESSIPVYSGKILVSGSNGETLGVPYFGKPHESVFVTNTYIIITSA